MCHFTRVVLGALALQAATASLATRPFASARRLRGGDAEAETDPHREEIIARLNQFPTFCILNGEDQLIGLPNEQGGHDVCWYADPAEAKELLALTQAGNPEDEGLHLGCTPLGNAFLMCGGWPGEGDDSKGAWSLKSDDARYLLRGLRAGADEAAPTLRSQLEAQGIDCGTWQFACYCHDDFQDEKMMYFFLSVAELQAGWVRNGRPELEVPDEPMMMDLRLLVGAMLKDDDVRAKAQLVPTKEAYLLSQEIMKPAGAAADGGGEEE